MGAENMLMNWSNSTGSGRAALSGMVPPSGKPLVEVPFAIWTYFRPRDDRGRMSTVESTGTGLTEVSSLVCTTA